MRRDEKNDMKAAIEYKISGKRLRDRPRKRWLDGLSKDAERRVLDINYSGYILERYRIGIRNDGRLCKWRRRREDSHKAKKKTMPSLDSGPLLLSKKR